MSQGEPEVDARSLRLRNLRVCIYVIATLVFVASMWPEDSIPVQTWDTDGYLKWPGPVKTGDVIWLGPRLPVYPLFLKLVSLGPVLVYVQSWLALGSFLLLGVRVAGLPGFLVGGLLATATDLAWWNQVALTESLCHSLLALFVVTIVELARRWRASVAGAALVLALLLALLKVTNAALLPGLLLCLAVARLAPQRFRFGTPGERKEWRRIAGFAAVIIAIGLTSFALSSRSEGWRINYYTAYRFRIAPVPAYREFFRERGAPMPIRADPERGIFARAALAAERRASWMDWFDTHGKRSYETWVVSRWASYREAVGWLGIVPDPEWRREQRPDHAGLPVLRTVADSFFAYSAPPGWLWLGVLLGALALQSTRRSDEGVLAWVAIGLGGGACVVTFVAGHGSAVEIGRHVLVGSVAYRLALLVALASIASNSRTRIGGPGPASTPDPGATAHEARTHERDERAPGIAVAAPPST